MTAARNTERPKRRRPDGSKRRTPGRDRRPPGGSAFDATGQIDRNIRSVIEGSVADATEILWLDRHHLRAGLNVPVTGTEARRQQTVEIRVHSGGRLGEFRTGRTSWSELDQAVRLAMASAAARSPGTTPFLEQPDAVPRVSGFDRRLARLEAKDVVALLAPYCRDDEAALLDWTDGQVLIRNSRGLHLSQRVTSVQVQIRNGLGAGAGFASDAARHLEDLDLEALFERARARRATTTVTGELENRPQPLLLAPEATAELVEMLNQRAFAAQAYCDGTSFLREHLGVQVFDHRLNLRDDATDPSGLVFPFDLEGRPKRPIGLVESGVPRTPTLDSHTAAVCGLEATGHGLCPGEAYGLNLFMEPGTSSESELIAAADGGLWISRLDAVECFDTSRMAVRARARGVRRIDDGKLSQPLPDVLWEDSLLRIFAGFVALGRTTTCRLSADKVLGGISAPAVVLDQGVEIRLA